MRYEFEAGCARVVLDDRVSRNALSVATLAELRAVVARAAADPAVRVLVVSHTGDVFSSGIDLREATGAPADRQPITAFGALLAEIRDASIPVLARVGGRARGAGAGLVAGCDLAVAGRSADFALTEVRLGLVPASVAAPLRRRVGDAITRELLLTADVVDADRALRIGLVNSVVDDADLDAEVNRYVDLLRAAGPGAAAATKRLLGRDLARTEDPAAMSALSARHFAGAEGQEGIAAHRERRPPRWATPDS